MTLQELTENFAMDIARIDKLKSKTPEGSAGFLHLCQKQHWLIRRMIENLKPVVDRLA